MSGFFLFSAPSIKVFFWFVPEAGGDPPPKTQKGPFALPCSNPGTKETVSPPFPPLLKEEGAKLLKAPFRVLRLLSSLGPSPRPHPTRPPSISLRRRRRRRDLPSLRHSLKPSWEKAPNSLSDRLPPLHFRPSRGLPFLLLLLLLLLRLGQF